MDDNFGYSEYYMQELSNIEDELGPTYCGTKCGTKCGVRLDPCLVLEEMIDANVKAKIAGNAGISIRSINRGEKPTYHKAGLEFLLLLSPRLHSGLDLDNKIGPKIVDNSSNYT